MSLGPRSSSPTSSVLTRSSSFEKTSTHDDIIPGAYEIGDERPQTYFRSLTQSSARTDHRTEGEAGRIDRIYTSRGALKWLPMHSLSNDICYAMYWFILGSIFTTLIPVVPLIAICEDLFWQTNEDFVPKYEHIGLYSTMIFCGVCWTLASYIFGRACEDEPLKPILSSIYCCATDELLSTWLMFFGIFPSIFICGVYLKHHPEDIEWRLGLIGSIICTLLTLVFVYFFLPRQNKSPYRNIISPFFTCFCGPCPRNGLRRHFQNDLLVLCWMSVWGCVVVCLVTFVLTFYSIYTKEIFEIYEYSTFFLNCLMFLVGSLYFTAGSYPQGGGLAGQEGEGGNVRTVGRMSGVAGGKGPIVGVLGSRATVALEV